MLKPRNKCIPYLKTHLTQIVTTLSSSVLKNRLTTQFSMTEIDKPCTLQHKINCPPLPTLRVIHMCWGGLLSQYSGKATVKWGGGEISSMRWSTDATSFVQHKNGWCGFIFLWWQNIVLKENLGVLQAVYSNWWNNVWAGTVDTSNCAEPVIAAGIWLSLPESQYATP